MIHVVAAAVMDAAGRVLIAQRLPGKHLAGGWEFPGGKLEPGEPRRVGLARELREELNIAIREPRPLMRVRHTYPYGEVLLDMWVASRYDGEPRGVDGQALRWLTQDELATAELLPADRPIVRALRLPERLGREIDTPLHGAPCSTVEEARRAETSGRAEFLIVRRELPDQELERLCDAVGLPVFARGADLEWAWARGATGVHGIEFTG